jgi:hypothetical protein
VSLAAEVTPSRIPLFGKSSPFEPAGGSSIISSSPHKKQRAAQQQQQQQVPRLTLGTPPAKTPPSGRGMGSGRSVGMRGSSNRKSPRTSSKWGMTPPRPAAAAAAATPPSSGSSRQQHRYTCQGISVTSRDEAWSLIAQGLGRRRTVPTAQNPHSNRAHTLITFTLQQLRPAPQQQQQQQQQQGKESSPAAAAAGSATTLIG